MGFSEVTTFFCILCKLFIFSQFLFQSKSTSDGLKVDLCKDLATICLGPIQVVDNSNNIRGT